MRLMKIGLTCLAVLVISTAPVFAGKIIQAIGVSSANDPDPGFDLSALINQSSLAASYTSGVTDFDTYTSTTTAFANSFADLGGRETPFPVNFDFDLGAVYTVDAIALWNQSGSASIRGLTLYGDTASDFSSATNLGGYVAGGGNGSLADIFSFSAINAQYIRIQATSNAGFTDAVRFNEFAARGDVVVRNPVRS